MNLPYAYTNVYICMYMCKCVYLIFAPPCLYKLNEICTYIYRSAPTN